MFAVLILHPLYVAYSLCSYNNSSSISNAMSSLLPSRPEIKLHYTTSANDVNCVHGYVMLLQL